MIVYFSGTGNSAWVAKRLATALNDTCVAIGNSSSYTVAKGEALGFVFPVYSWGPPSVMAQCLDAMDLSLPSYIYFVCTCGDDTGKTASIFSKMIAKREGKCHAGFSVQMPNTYICLPGFDVDSDSVEQRKVTNALSRIDYIAQCITDRQLVTDCFEGAMPFTKSYIIRPFFLRFLMNSKRFAAVKEQCTGCGKCAKVCPLQNITLNKTPLWGSNCQHCLACYHACPTRAIRYSTFTDKKGQYKGKYLK